MSECGRISADGGVSLCNGLMGDGPNAKIDFRSPLILAVAYDQLMQAVLWSGYT